MKCGKCGDEIVKVVEVSKELSTAECSGCGKEWRFDPRITGMMKLEHEPAEASK